MGRGGPFLALLRRTKLLRDDGRHRELPFMAMIAVTWVPIVVLAGATHQEMQVLTNFSIHARLLVSMPLLFEADLVLHELVGITLGCFAGARVAQGLDPASLEEVQRRAERLRSSSTGEAACLLLALLVGPLALWGRTAGFSGIAAHSVTPLSAASLWYGWVSTPAFSFLLFRVLWRWLIWCWTLWRISRLELRLVPTHPDSCGGLGVLVIPNRGFSLMLVAVAAGVAGVWGDQDHLSRRRARLLRATGRHVPWSSPCWSAWDRCWCSPTSCCARRSPVGRGMGPGLGLHDPVRRALDRSQPEGGAARHR